MKLDDNDRLYMRFRARDRFRLMCQAAVRLDINELKRLAATARRVPVLVPHHYFDAHAFRLLNEEHHLHMQELALGIVLLQTQSERGVDCHPAIDLACWDLLRYREGWIEFCTQLGVEPDLAYGLSEIGNMQLDTVTQIARELAPPDDQIPAILKALSERDVQPATVESIASQYQRKFEAYAKIDRPQAEPQDPWDWHRSMNPGNRRSGGRSRT